MTETAGWITAIAVAVIAFCYLVALIYRWPSGPRP